MKDTWWIKPEQLDPAQREVIGLSRKQSHLVLGPPGSGKTNLLLLRAKHLWLAGERDFEVLVFNGALREFLRSGAADYAIDPDKIKTSRKWLLDLLGECGVNVYLPTGFREQQAALLDAVEAAISRHGLKAQVGTLLLDEVQDYTPREIAIFQKLSKHIFAAGDIRQKIYEGESPIDVLTRTTGDPKRLEHHYRNGEDICAVADDIAKKDGEFSPLLDACNYKDSVFGKCVVNREVCSTFDEQISKVIARLRLQIKAFPDELLGVICPKTDETKKVWDAIRRSDLGELAVFQNRDEGYTKFGKKHVICVASIHSAKGMEFRAVHFLSAESGGRFWARQRNIYYTAVTRAKTALSVYHSKGLPAYVEQAFSSLEGARREPSIKDLFAKGGA